uniref:Uncharacterized protein n=1 Tax=Anopheles christyi TaxID=43041 RepID=A0A182K3S0_9DIPT
MFKKVMEDFKDPTGELSSILHWTPESFTINCRTFLNNIPGRKYYSLAAISAVLGTNVFNPLRGKNFISFEWNTNPSELTFQASFADDTDRSIQASIELSDIHCVKIIEDLNAPRVECSYEKIVIIGDSTETYDLKINASNNKELYELASFLKARIPSEKIVYKPLPPVVDDSEIILRHEKLYDTMEITHNGLQQHNDNCVIGDDIKDNESPAKELASIENGNEDESNFSNPDFPPLSTTKWPFKFIDLSDNRKKTDPYDLLHMREEEREQKRKQKKNNATGMGNGHGKKNEKVGNGTNAKNKKRPTYMESSTPTKRSRAAMIKTVPNDLDGISSIYNISDDEQSDNNDSDFVPYVMLSGAGNRNGRNKKQIKTQTQTFSTARRIGGRTRDMNVKQPAAKKALH